MGFTIPRSAGLEADGPLSLSSLVVLWAKRKEDAGCLKLCTHPSRFTPTAAGEAVRRVCQAGEHDRSAEREHRREMRSTQGCTSRRSGTPKTHCHSLSLRNCKTHTATFLSEELEGTLNTGTQKQYIHTGLFKSTATIVTLFQAVLFSQARAARVHNVKR